MWSIFSMYWSFSETRNLPLTTSSLATSDSSEAYACSSVMDSANATSCTEAGAKQSRYLMTMRSVASSFSTGGYSTRPNSHLLPERSDLVMRYMDSSFLSDLTVMSSLISSFSEISLRGVSMSMASYTALSVSLSSRSFLVAAA